MLIMLPLPWANITRSSCFMLSSTPRTLVSNVLAYVSAVCEVIGPITPSVPALFTATSSLPNRFTVSSTSDWTSDSCRTSAFTNCASAPSSRSSFSSCLPSFSRRPETTMLAPATANTTAVARPMPVSAPVIKTTCFEITTPYLLSDPLRTSLRLRRPVKGKTPGIPLCRRLPHTAFHTSKRHILISFRRWGYCSKCNPPCRDNRCNALSERAATCPHHCVASSRRVGIPSPLVEVPAPIQRLLSRQLLHGLCLRLVRSSW